jgi:hypothetical protein
MIKKGGLLSPTFAFAISIMYLIVLNFFFVDSGERTFGVLTKIDLMKDAKNVVHVSSYNLATYICPNFG